MLLTKEALLKRHSIKITSLLLVMRTTLLKQLNNVFVDLEEL